MYTKLNGTQTFQSNIFFLQFLSPRHWYLYYCLHMKMRTSEILTLNHDHIDIYGANLRLGQTLALFQQIGNLLWSHR